MAFRLPQAAPPQRHVSQTSRPQLSRHSSLHRPLDQSQEWVLFSPSTCSQTISATEVTPRTAGLSDYGSLNSILPPSQDDAEREGGDVDDLDSLDDGLHEFRAPSHIPSTGRQDLNENTTILPQHDGLGSFQASSQAVQEHLWQHERYNPRRRSFTAAIAHHRTTSSIHRRLEAIDDELEKEHPFMEGEKLDRIERWRLDQSKVMLDEVQKEARRRRRLSLGGHSQARSIPAIIDTSDISVADARTTKSMPLKSVEESENFWQRITRRVIKDFMGIDDSVLSVILGESLPGDDLFSTTPKAINSQTLSEKLKSVEEEQLAAGWEDRLLKRLARELNTIVHNLSDQPAASSLLPTTSTRPESYEYAGIPIKKTRTHPTILESEELELGQTPKADPSMTALFSPTLRRRAQESLEATEHEAGWGIEDSNPTDDGYDAKNLAYWEQTPDLRQVFAYLSRRFLKRNDGSLPPPASIADMTASASTATATTTPTTATTTTSRTRNSIATHATPESLRRAAIIREHHPLVSRAHEARLAKQRRSQHQRRPSLKSIAERPGAGVRATISTTDRPAVAASEGGAVPSSPVAAAAAAADMRSLKRFGDDCASQSTKRSKTSRSRKHYWDRGSDSAAAALGGMGAWGEV